MKVAQEDLKNIVIVKYQLNTQKALEMFIGICHTTYCIAYSKQQLHTD